MITEPMLAGKGKIEDLKYPVLASPKLDGIRCVTVMKDGRVQALSRKFKPIPNRFIREWIEANLPAGLDGELMVLKNGAVGTFQDCSSGVMSFDGEPDFQYWVFDRLTQEGGLREGYQKRMEGLQTARLPRVRVFKVLPVMIDSVESLEALEVKFLAEGYEGVMVRQPNSPYKCGRSTTGEGYLLKIKRFLDAEAVVVGVEEMMTNNNAAEEDAFGRTKRSTCKAGKVGAGMMGVLSVRDMKTGFEFGIGTGFNQAQRIEMWGVKQSLIGKIVKYKYQPTGVKDSPRFPVFEGFRHEDDFS